MKVSIIVPVYNTGEYLRKCFKSLQKQTLSDIEFIIVDDGSSDNSGAICDEFAKTDSRFRVIHKKNEGVSVARNVGIEAAQGEYIGFVDSDDWIDEDMYLQLYSAALDNDAEFVICDCTTVCDNKFDEPDTITQLENSILLEKNQITPSYLLELAGGPCRCLYNRQMLLDYEVKFPNGIKISEDRIFNIYAIGCSNRLYYIKKSYYNRYVRKGSAVYSYHKDLFDIALNVREKTMQAVISAWDGKEEYLTIFENHLVTGAYSAINSVFYKESNLNFKYKLLEVKRICANTELRSAIDKLGRNDLRAKLIKRQAVLSLSVLAKVLNKKYGR